MRYGYFDDANGEYVIDRPDTPRAWSNYLGSRAFGGVITNNAGGYAFYRSSAIGRFTRLHFNALPMDQPGRYFYLRDKDSGDYWSAAWQPVGKPLAQYASTCRFGTGYASIESRYAGITSVSTYFVPQGQTFECWRLALTNTGATARTLDVFTYCEFANEWNIFQDAFNLQYAMYIARARMQNGFMQGSLNEHLKEDPASFANRDQSRWWWMTLRGAEVIGYDFHREAFIGPYRGYPNPLVVERGTCSSSEAYGSNACGCLQAQVQVQPGETKELLVLLGVGKADDEGARAVAQCSTPAQLDAARTAVKAHWHSKLTACRVSTPDDNVNHMLNIWSAYNTLMTFYWCRAASLVYSGDNRDGFGFRDTVQDLVGVMQLLPDEARQRLELMLTGQESNGGAMPEVKPYAHTPGAMPLTPPALQRSDDCLWFFNAIPEYVNETGDRAFYDKVLPYSDSGSATVFGHLKRALLFNLTRTGSHGLPCGLHADWDDCIRMGFHGETVMVALQLRYGLVVYEDIARQRGDAAEADWAAAERAKLDRILQGCTWDGQWFIRGYKETGEVLGSHTCAEGRIFQPIQSWAVISGAATPQQARAALDAVELHLETPYGVMCLMPPVVQADCKELRMVLMLPGEKENAGIFSHSQGWVVMANCIAGNGERAYRVYQANLPARFNDCADVRQIEPYVYCQTTSSRYSRREGMAHIPWLTGAAAWSYFAATHYILGIRPERDGLRIDPCIPSAWPGFSVTRIFRGKSIVIEVKNPRGHCKGVSSITLNGEVLPGNLIPVAKLRADNTVTCTIA